MSETIAENFARVQAKIAVASRLSGRQPENVRLVVVTKGHPVEAVLEVIEAGARRLGESYVDEGLAKIMAVEARLPAGQSPEWHMIGHVQRRKARQVPGAFDWVHSLDSLKLAEKLDRATGEQQGEPIPVLLECNTSGEASKFGWQAWDPSTWEQLIPQFGAVLRLKHLKVRGLMTMAPYAEDPELARPYFRKLRSLRDFLSMQLPEGSWEEISMGMSGDYIPAIEEGATFVRIGTAIMGPRTTGD